VIEPFALVHAVITTHVKTGVNSGHKCALRANYGLAAWSMIKQANWS
jgi:hypothetical protein